MTNPDQSKSTPQFSSDPGTYDLEPPSQKTKKMPFYQKANEPENLSDKPETFWDKLFKKHRPLEKE
ncbi:hypothetical protein MNBD_PLANCTO02-177, partial [hydrothermal vent metagenome]